MACRIVSIKRMTYRGNANEEYSNEYTFTGATPADSAAWTTLATALNSAEVPVLHTSVHIIASYGYDSESPTAHAVWTHDWTAGGTGPGVPGTYAASGGQSCPGDDAVWIRWKLDRLNSRGKPVYLRKYFHPAFSNASGAVDEAAPSWITAANTFGTKMMDGTFLDGRVLKAPGHSDAILSRLASAYVTTRTLKRRGKRPH